LPLYENLVTHGTVWMNEVLMDAQDLYGEAVWTLNVCTVRNVMNDVWDGRERGSFRQLVLVSPLFPGGALYVRQGVVLQSFKIPP
jgi:hypothetical protein